LRISPEDHPVLLTSLRGRARSFITDAPPRVYKAVRKAKSVDWT
jgi:hypothetical protein